MNKNSKPNKTKKNTNKILHMKTTESFDVHGYGVAQTLKQRENLREKKEKMSGVRCPVSFVTSHLPCHVLQHILIEVPMAQTVVYFLLKTILCLLYLLPLNCIYFLIVSPYEMRQNPYSYN